MDSLLLFHLSASGNGGWLITQYKTSSRYNNLNPHVVDNMTTKVMEFFMLFGPLIYEKYFLLKKYCLSHLYMYNVNSKLESECETMKAAQVTLIAKEF